MDASLVHVLNAFLIRHDGVEDPLVAYEGVAEALFLGALVLAFLTARGRLRRGTRHGVVAAGLSAGVALAVAQVTARLVDRPRPFVAHPGAVHLLSAHAADPSFPSDHATAAFAVAAAVLLRSRPWGLLALVAAAVLAVGRVAMGVHYPTDVLAGALLGSLAALALHAPPLRRVIERLADAADGVLDAIRAALPGRTRAQPRG